MRTRTKKQNRKYFENNKKVRTLTYGKMGIKKNRWVFHSTVVIDKKVAHKSPSKSTIYLWYCMTISYLGLHTIRISNIILPSSEMKRCTRRHWNHIKFHNGLSHKIGGALGCSIQISNCIIKSIRYQSLI